MHRYILIRYNHEILIVLELLMTVTINQYLSIPLSFFFFSLSLSLSLSLQCHRTKNEEQPWNIYPYNQAIELCNELISAARLSSDQKRYDEGEREMPRRTSFSSAGLVLQRLD